MLARVLFSGRVLTALTMFTIFLVMTIMAFGFPAKARLMPLMFGRPGVILGLSQLMVEIRKAMAEVPVTPGEDALLERKNEIQMFLWTFLFFIFILCFGFIYATPFLVFGFLYIAKSESLKVAIIGGICTWAVMYGVFQTWFEIPLFDGLIIEWITG
jgi:hypothetical protein